MRSGLAAASFALGFCACAAVQALDYPTAAIPRLSSGEPNLTAPAPRVRGTPDLSGIWMRTSGKYLFNLAADLKEVPFQPWAKALFEERD